MLARAIIKIAGSRIFAASARGELRKPGLRFGLGRGEVDQGISHDRQIGQGAIAATSPP